MIILIGIKLMINRTHLTVEGINSIREIKSGMNKGRGVSNSL